MNGVKSKVLETQLWGKQTKIGLRIYDRVSDLRSYIHGKYPDEPKPHQIIAYAETFRKPGRSGCVAVVHLWRKQADLETIAHESVHVASGIIATRYPGAVFTPTNDRAEDNEECFADAVGRFTHSIWTEFNRLNA